MSNSTVTPNMSLILPTPGQEPGPQYGDDQNQSFTILDSHNHSPGSGVQITPAGLDINTNLDFQNNNPYNVYGVQFSASTTSSNLRFLYTSPQSGGGIFDLFYNDGAGNVIALTKAGEVNATIASIPGESYAGGTFTWKQGAGSTTPANFDIGSITIRPNTAGTTNGVVVGPPSGISSQYNIFLPTLPSATSIMQMDTSGNMSTTLTVDNSTLTISSQVLQINPQGITQGLYALKTTGQTVTAGNLAISPSCGAYSNGSGTQQQVNNLSVTITTVGNPVYILLMPDGSSGSSYLQSTAPGGGIAATTFFIYRGATDIAQFQVGLSGTASGDVQVPPGCIAYYDAVGAGTYTYTIQSLSSGTTYVNFVVLTAREIP